MYRYTNQCVSRLLADSLRSWVRRRASLLPFYTKIRSRVSINIINYLSFSSLPFGFSRIKPESLRNESTGNPERRPVATINMPPFLSRIMIHKEIQRREIGC